ncbi:precorrin-3B C(17)-methyltransferase [Natranaeroarchaeum sulfidigenes]|uniref:Precorrin-3B methylase n=1 Tax=Natranaeroarchaeum sulfidigenes TaxID=2784880 RepID=A0A897MJY3_9EURY|nr:Precorrin-3B methylase [Natranaeroarchaeum sulfidigenes]
MSDKTCGSTDESTSNCGGSDTAAEAATNEAATDGGATEASGSAAEAAESSSADAAESSSSKCGANATEGSSDSSNCGASSSSSSNESSCGAPNGSKTDEKVTSTVEDFDAEPGRLFAVGLGPGQAEGMTQRARATLMEAEHIVGYTTYIELLPDDVVEAADELYDTPMCGEVSRTEEAVDRALAGNDVAIIGSGDPNVYALGGLALEIIESKGATASMLDFEVVPGVPAAQSCAARVGAPLVNDTVSISLSDHLTPMSTIESRLHAAAKEGFTIAIYNPWSRKRRENFQTACEILLEHRSEDTAVGVVHGAGRDDEQVRIVELGALEELGETDLVDMTTTILVGNEETYVWDGRMVTPRGYESKYDY